MATPSPLGAPPVVAPSKPRISHLKVAVLVAFIVIVPLAIGTCAKVGCIAHHYLLDTGHEMAQVAVASHTDILAELGRPLKASSTWCPSSGGRNVVNYVATDEHTFEVVGPKGKGTASVWVEASGRNGRISFEIKNMNLVVDGRFIAIDPAKLAADRRIRRAR